MYFIDIGLSPVRIMKAGLDGKNLQTFINIDAENRPEGLAIDYQGLEVFYSLYPL